jgi:hypothetical protein
MFSDGVFAVLIFRGTTTRVEPGGRESASAVWDPGVSRDRLSDRYKIRKTVIFARFTTRAAEGKDAD